MDGRAFIGERARRASPRDGRQRLPRAGREVALGPRFQLRVALLDAPAPVGAAHETIDAAAERADVRPLWVIADEDEVARRARGVAGDVDLRVRDDVLVEVLGRVRVVAEHLGERVPSLEATRLAAHGVADPLRVLGEDVDEVLLGAVVEALRVAIERAHDVALVLEPAHPCFDRSVGHPRPSHQRGRRERNLSTRRPRVEQRERWRGIGPMRSARVGRSGLTVSKLCLGTWYFGGPTPYDEALALMRAALDGGITFWDTSDHYNAGGSESVIGRGLRELGVRDEIVLATKVFYPRGPGPNDRGGGSRYLLRELDGQLKGLRRIGSMCTCCIGA